MNRKHQKLSKIKSQPIVIRRAIPNDGPEVCRFVFEISRSYGIEPEPQGLDADVMEFGSTNDSSVTQWVAEFEGQVVGSVALSHRENGVGWLSTLFVALRYRGHGIGRALLEQAVAEAGPRGYHRIDLETRQIYKEAIHLYESSGWVRGPDLPPEDAMDRTYSLFLR